MQIYRNFPHFSLKKPSVITIGNFDGIHRGHQMLLQKTLEIAEQKRLISTVITFYSPNYPPLILTTLAQKLCYFRALGINQVIILPFNNLIKNLTASTFLTILKQRLSMQHLVIGQNFTCGKNREGNSEFLFKNFKSLTVVNLLNDYETISSSLIRKLLAVGDLHFVEKLLGHPLILRGRLKKQKKTNYFVVLKNFNRGITNKLRFEIENSKIYGEIVLATDSCFMQAKSIPASFENKILNFRIITD